MFNGFRSRCTMFCRCAAPTPAATAADQFVRPLGLHLAFLGKNLLQRSSFHKLHHEERHRAANHSEVGYCNYVLVFDCGGRECFLAKTRGQHRIVTNQIRQDDFDCVRGFKEDMSRLKTTPMPPCPSDVQAGSERRSVGSPIREGVVSSPS